MCESHWSTKEGTVSTSAGLFLAPLPLSLWKLHVPGSVRKHDEFSKADVHQAVSQEAAAGRMCICTCLPSPSPKPPLSLDSLCLRCLSPEAIFGGDVFHAA